MASRFAQLSFQGPDAAAFLQGYVTADMDALQSATALPMACCNLKGRVVVSGWAAGTPSDVRLVLAEAGAEALAAHLGKYLLFSKSKFSPATGIGFAPAPSPGAVALPPTGWHATLDAPADATHSAFATACAAAGFVAVAPPVADAFLPQMVGLTRIGAVSFAKGCYLGQEVVARAEHRGQVKQLLRAYATTGPLPPVGAEVVSGAGKVGVVVATGDGRVLAVTRSDASPVTAAGATLDLAPSVDDGVSPAPLGTPRV